MAFRPKFAFARVSGTQLFNMTRIKGHINDDQVQKYQLPIKLVIKTDTSTISF